MDQPFAKWLIKPLPFWPNNLKRTCNKLFEMFKCKNNPLIFKTIKAVNTNFSWLYRFPAVQTHFWKKCTYFGLSLYVQYSHKGCCDLSYVLFLLLHMWLATIYFLINVCTEFACFVSIFRSYNNVLVFFSKFWIVQSLLKSCSTDWSTTFKNL